MNHEEMYKLNKKWKWVEKIIHSCTTQDQLDAAIRLTCLLCDQYARWYPQTSLHMREELNIDLLIKKQQIQNP